MWVGHPLDPERCPDFSVSLHTLALQTDSWLPLGWAVHGLRLSAVGSVLVSLCHVLWQQ